MHAKTPERPLQPSEVVLLNSLRRLLAVVPQVRARTTASLRVALPKGEMLCLRLSGLRPRSGRQLGPQLPAKQLCCSVGGTDRCQAGDAVLRCCAVQTEHKLSGWAGGTIAPLGAATPAGSHSQARPPSPAAGDSQRDADC